MNPRAEAMPSTVLFVDTAAPGKRRKVNGGTETLDEEEEPELRHGFYEIDRLEQINMELAETEDKSAIDGLKAEMDDIIASMRLYVEVNSGNENDDKLDAFTSKLGEIDAIEDAEDDEGEDLFDTYEESDNEMQIQQNVRRAELLRELGLDPDISDEDARNWLRDLDQDNPNLTPIVQELNEILEDRALINDEEIEDDDIHRNAYEDDDEMQQNDRREELLTELGLDPAVSNEIALSQLLDQDDERVQELNAILKNQLLDNDEAEAIERLREDAAGYQTFDDEEENPFLEKNEGWIAGGAFSDQEVAEWLWGPWKKFVLETDQLIYPDGTFGAGLTAKELGSSHVEILRDGAIVKVGSTHSRDIEQGGKLFKKGTKILFERHQGGLSRMPGEPKVITNYRHAFLNNPSEGVNCTRIIWRKRNKAFVQLLPNHWSYSAAPECVPSYRKLDLICKNNSEDKVSDEERSKYHGLRQPLENNQPIFRYQMLKRMNEISVLGLPKLFQMARPSVLAQLWQHYGKETPDTMYPTERPRAVMSDINIYNRARKTKENRRENRSLEDIYKDLGGKLRYPKQIVLYETYRWYSPNKMTAISKYKEACSQKKLISFVDEDPGLIYDSVETKMAEEIRKLKAGDFTDFKYLGNYRTLGFIDADRVDQFSLFWNKVKKYTQNIRMDRGVKKIKDDLYRYLNSTNERVDNKLLKKLVVPLSLIGDEADSPENRKRRQIRDNTILKLTVDRQAVLADNMYRRGDETFENETTLIRENIDDVTTYANIYRKALIDADMLRFGTLYQKMGVGSRIEVLAKIREELEALERQYPGENSLEEARKTFAYETEIFDEQLLDERDYTWVQREQKDSLGKKFAALKLQNIGDRIGTWSGYNWMTRQWYRLITANDDHKEQVENAARM